MVQSLPWLLGAVLGAGTAQAAAPDATPPADAPSEAAATEPVTAGDAGEPTDTDASASESESEARTTETSAEGEPAEASATETSAPADTSATETSAAEPATKAPARPASSAPPVPADPDARPSRTYPRLVIAGGPIVGPHAVGNEECNPERGRCETKGSFIGLGGQVELRARIWKLVYAHARGLAVGNVSANDRIHRGLWGVGAGVGLQGRRAFGRAEYLFLDTFGDNHFEPPFYQGEVASDEWGHHAGMLSVGFRQPLPHRLSAELWGGLVIGPRSVRRVPDLEPEERVLTTFLVGLNVSWDAWP